MSLSLILAAIWVLAGAAVAALPMRYQYAPGLVLVLAAVPLLIFIAMQHGVWLVLGALAVIVSMFRKPLRALLRYMMRRARGDGAGGR